MRLSRDDVDEPFSVPATQQNKRLLTRWARTISLSQERGKAPYEPLRFALKQKPDAIYLLSDGEFPERFERLLNEENRFENLFGDSGRISIIHTISYHSSRGEIRMRRIAERNGGQYRHVPKPR